MIANFEVNAMFYFCACLKGSYRQNVRECFETFFVLANINRFII